MEKISPGSCESDLDCHFPFVRELVRKRRDVFGCFGIGATSNIENAWIGKRWEVESEGRMYLDKQEKDIA